MPEEGSAVYRAELPGSVLPELQIFASPADVPEEEPEWTPVTAEKETLADGTAVYTWQTGESGTEAALYVRLAAAAPDAEPETDVGNLTGPGPETDAPAESVTIIVHYRTADGAAVMEDDTYLGVRGTAVPVYAKAAEEGWTIVSDPLTYVDIPEDGPDTVEVEFIYTSPTPTPAPPDVRVTVHYRDVGGVPVASDTVTVCPGGSVQQIYAAPEDLKPDYYPTSESVQQVNVNA